MEGKIEKLYHKDRAGILLMLLAMWAVLIYAMSRILQVAPDRTTGIIIVSIGVVTGSFATASLLAVLSHLKKNKEKLYTEELKGNE